jgi:hypothetical protein
MRYMLAEEWEIKLLGEPQPPAPLTFSPDVERQNQLIMACTHLCEGKNMLSQCEFYFRRYPFHGTPVPREDHARNMCEFYFGCFYIIKNRLKETLNRLKAVCPHSKVHIGKTLRAFERAFEQEIRIRNSIQHHQPYGDVVIERISLARLLASAKSAHSKSWERQHLTAYRKFCASFEKRVGSPQNWPAPVH